jgi:hypothetical protein
MRTQVDPAALGVCARSLSTVSAELADARQQLSAIHASSAGDLGAAGSAAAHDTRRSGDRALTTVADAASAVADAMRLLATVYDAVDREAVR